MSQLQQTFFLGRQPILNIRQEIVGFELLFRSSEINLSDHESQNHACMSVISTALSGFGFSEVLGDKTGFINITEEVLLSDVVELLPRKQSVLELLESVPLNDEICQRCRVLKSKGYQIALDDHIFRIENLDAYRIVDFVKIDILQTGPDELPGTVSILNTYPVKLLAEKVETPEQFEMCRKLGFELFQGYFFARPDVLKQKLLAPSKIAMLPLLGTLKIEADFREIEECFRSSPELALSLIKLVNSVGIGLREKIKSLRHAITLLGIDQLRRWVHLAIFASTDSRGIHNPLLELAAVRGRMMEYLVMERHSLIRGSEKVEAAFMTGILSLMDILLETTIDAIVSELSLSDEISAALLHREGELGTLLALAENLEKNDLDEARKLVETVDIPLTQLLAAQMEAFNWRSSIKA